MYFALSALILQAQIQQSVEAQPNIVYDIAKQLLTVGTIVILIVFILKSKQKDTDTKQALLAEELKAYKLQSKEEKKELKEMIEKLELRVRGIETNYISRFEEVNGGIAGLTTKVEVILEKIENLNK